jgi:hypothetical protein
MRKVQCGMESGRSRSKTVSYKWRARVRAGQPGLEHGPDRGPTCKGHWQGPCASATNAT